MKTLGAVLAGGRSSRFGSDKAMALYRGKPLLSHARDALLAHCSNVVVIGRVPGLPDWPEPALGPMGGVAGALRYACAQGFDRVLTVPVDCLNLPDDLLDTLSPAPAFLVEQPVIGLWPAAAFEQAMALLGGEAKKSMRAFAAAIGARPVDTPMATRNINTPEDLMRVDDTNIG